MLKVFASCVLVVFAMKSSFTLTHEVTFTVAQASSRSINDQSQVSHLSLVLLVNHVEHVCMDVLSCFVIEACECVFSWSYIHLSIMPTLSHFVEVLKTRLPSDSRTIIPPSTRSTITQKHQASLSKLWWSQEIQSAFMLTTWTVAPDSHLGTDSPQKLHRGYWPYLLCWLGKLRR